MVSEKMGSEVVAASRLQLGTIGPPMPKVDGVPKEGEKPSAHQNGQLKPVCSLEYVVEETNCKHSIMLELPKLQLLCHTITCHSQQNC